jgi:ERCC4-type nuclease
MATLVLDAREHSLIRCLPEVEVRGLDIGDAQVLVGGEPLVIFERKSQADLAASIVDGRFKEQRARLLATAPSCRLVVYVVEMCPGFECDPDAMVGGIRVGAFNGALLSLQLKYGVSVFVTARPSETAMLMQLVLQRVVAGRVQPTEDEVVYHSCVKVRKNENLDPRTCCVLQLATVPRVSARIAAAIMNRFGCSTMAALVGALSPREEATRALAETVVGSKKLGGKAAASIMTSLFGR